MAQKTKQTILDIESNLICLQCGKKYIIPRGRSLKYLKSRKFCSLRCYHKHPNSKVGLFKKGHKVKMNREDKSVCWKGDNVGYSTIHKWVKQHKGKAKQCIFCKTKSAKRYEWANINHQYKRKLSDYISLCCSCHYKFDRLLQKKNGVVGNRWD